MINQTRRSRMRITTMIVTITAVLTCVQQLVVASLKNNVVVPSDARAPRRPTFGGAGGGEAGHGSARYGNSFLNVLSFFVARGHCGLSITAPSTNAQSPCSQVSNATSSSRFRPLGNLIGYRLV